MEKLNQNVKSLVRRESKSWLTAPRIKEAMSYIQKPKRTSKSVHMPLLRPYGEAPQRKILMNKQQVKLERAVFAMRLKTQ